MAQVKRVPSGPSSTFLFVISRQRVLQYSLYFLLHSAFTIKDVPGGIPKGDLLGVTVARIHVAGQ